MEPEEIFEDCQSSDDELYEDCPAGPPEKQQKEPVMTAGPADATPKHGERPSVCQSDEVSPLADQPAAKDLSVSQPPQCEAASESAPEGAHTATAETAAAGDHETTVVDGPATAAVEAHSVTTHDTLKVAEECEQTAAEFLSTAAGDAQTSNVEGASVATSDLFEDDRPPRSTPSSEGDSSESGPAPETMARSWQVLDTPDAAVSAEPPSGHADTAPRPTGAAPDIAQLADAVSDTATAPRPTGAAPDIVQLADAVSDTATAAESDSKEGSPAAEAGAAGAPPPPPKDSDDDAEIVTDPDAVDEEALRHLDAAEPEEQRERRRQRAAGLKAEGNQLYAAASYDAARERYTAALRLCPLAAGRERAVLFSNRAACRARADDETGAVADCTRALELDAEYARPLQRRAELHERADRLDEALEDWRRLLQLRPDCGEARRAVLRLPPQIAERNERLKNEMLGKLKELGNMFMRPFGLSTDNFQMEQNEGGGYSVKFQQS